MGETLMKVEDDVVKENCWKKCLKMVTDYIREYSSVALLEVSPFPEII